MPSDNSIPSSPRYRYAIEEADKLLFEFDIDQFPIDPISIIKQLKNCYIFSWQKLKKNTGIDDPLNLRKNKLEGRCVRFHEENNDYYLIVYDKNVSNPNRIRWTIAHELGHIILGHLAYDELLNNDGSFNENKYAVLEREAHQFAAELLSPAWVIEEFKEGNEQIELVETICQITHIAAEKRINSIMDYSTRNDYMFPVLRNFFHVLEEHSFIKTNYSNISINDIVIDSKFDDYVEYPFWHYLLWFLEESDDTDEIIKALYGSVALYDDNSMVIYVKDMNAKLVVDNELELICSVLKDYAWTKIDIINVITIKKKHGKK